MAGVPLQNLLQYLRRATRLTVADDTDRELLARFAANRDEAAFAALVRRHAAMVLAVCRRMLGNDHDAEEAFQATFVILAAKAGAAGWHESVAGWLQAVAFRTASNHRAGTARRQRHEREVPQMQPVDSLAAEVDARDLRRVLDEELSRLPEKYRVPLVLCYLEGKTNDEAAQQLGWTLGSVAGRLAQGRDLLRGRLARRGLALSAAALPASLTAASAGAAVPVGLIDSTIQATLLGQAALAGPVATLAEGVLKTMWLTKLKLGAVVLLTVAVVGTGATVGAYHVLGGGSAGVAGRLALAPLPEPDVKVKPPGGDPVKGLKLTLTADKTETVMKADGRNAEPVELTWALTNVSDQPIKVDLYGMWGSVYEHYDIRAVGPDNDSVLIEALDGGRAPRIVAPREQDYVTLAPGKSVSTQIKYPVAFHHARVRFVKPGEYRLTVIYTNGAVAKNEFAANSWTGSVTSNELVLKVRAAGDAPAAAKGGAPVKGLKLTLSADKTETVMMPDGSSAVPVELTWTLTNVSDQPIKVDLFREFDWAGLNKHYEIKAVGPDKDSVRVEFRDGRRPRRVEPQDEDYVTLVPGKSLVTKFKYPGVIHEHDSLFFIKAGEYRITVTYTNDSAAKNKFAEGSWTGSVTTNELVLKVVR